MKTTRLATYAVTMGLAVTMLSSCYRMELSAAGLNNQVQVNPTSEPVKKHFNESRWNHYFLFALVPTSEVKISDVLASHAAPADHVVGLKVKKEMTFLNGLICVFIGFIYCPDTVKIEGDVVAGAGPR